MKKTIIALGASALLLVAAACDEAEPTPDPALTFCDSVEAMAASVEALEGLGIDNTVEEVEAGIDAVAEAAAAVKDSAGDLAESQAEAIEDAVAELQSFRDTIEDDQTIAEVLASLADDVAAVRQARIEAGTVHCGYEEAEAAVEEVESTVEEAAEEAEAAAEDAASEVQEDVEEAVDEAGAEAEEMVDDAEAAAEDAAGEVEEMAEDAEEAVDEASESDE